MLPSDPGAVWSRRTFMVAVGAVVYGCATQRRDAPPPTPVPAPPPEAPPPVAAPPPEPRRFSWNAAVSPAVARAIDHVLAQDSEHPRAAVLDFTAHSSRPRFHVIDRTTGDLLQSLRVAHGHGSEGKRNDGYAEVFSNEPNSNASSLGLYRTAEMYHSDIYPGVSMRMDGLSLTNSNARSRFIVIHEAWYMEPESWKGKKNGRPGRSEGCFAFSRVDRDTVIADLAGGALIYACYDK